MADIRLLPESYSNDRNKALVSVFDGPGDLNLDLIFVNPLTVDKGAFPALIREEGLEAIIDDSTPEQAVRRTLFFAPILHDLRGSPVAVELGLFSYGITARVIEWFEEDADPHTYRIVASLNENIADEGEPIISDENLIQAEASIEFWGRYSQRYSIELSSEHSAEMSMGAAMFVSPALSLEAEVAGSVSYLSSIQMGAAFGASPALFMKAEL
jgi:P2-related tail formation protein